MSLKRGILISGVTAAIGGIALILKKIYEEQNKPAPEKKPEGSPQKEPVAPKEFAVDLDGDGVPDAIATDVDGDGVADMLEVDTDGDGVPDTLYTDTDDDGSLDTEMILKKAAEETAEE
jgi:hypothetical protein